MVNQSSGNGSKGTWETVLNIILIIVGIIIIGLLFYLIYRYISITHREVKSPKKVVTRPPPRREIPPTVYQPAPPQNLIPLRPRPPTIPVKHNLKPSDSGLITGFK